MENWAFCRSSDLESWTEGSPDYPLLEAKQIPDHPTIENVCVLEQPDGFLMFFSFVIANGVLAPPIPRI